MTDPIRLAAQIGRVPSMFVSLDAEQERRFADLMANLALVDMHQHTPVLPESVDDSYTWGYAAAFAGQVDEIGLVCVTAVPNSLSDDPHRDINCVLDHYDYLANLVGEDHVGIGTHSVVGDHIAYTRLLMRPDGPPPPAAYLNGLESPADGFNIIRGLIARGYAERTIRKIAGLNAWQLLRRVIG
jgi:hypothetical protein